MYMWGKFVTLLYLIHRCDNVKGCIPVNAVEESTYCKFVEKSMHLNNINSGNTILKITT